MTQPSAKQRLDHLSQTVARLQERLGDLRDLEEAIVENAGQPLISWERTKAELEMD